MDDGRFAVTVDDLAADLGVIDALLFRRVSSSSWAHLGGLGRGRGWAGLVDLDAATDPLLAHVPTAGGVHTFGHSTARRVLGPYYAVGGALVRLSNDVLVVLGNPTRKLSADATTQQLLLLAQRLETTVDEVAPAKRLGDELEVLHAVRAVITVPATDVTGTLLHILDVALEALSCEIGFLRDGTGRMVSVSRYDGFDQDAAGVGRTLDMLEGRALGGTLCIQDSAVESALAPLGLGQGVHSLLVLAIPAPVGGILVAAHTSAGPRGFTTLCQRLGEQVADATSVVAHTAALRDELRMVADQHYRSARTDALTGLGNRLYWDEALVRAQERVDAGETVSIITLDVDGLKKLNDSFGHAVGDDLLRRCADVLRAHCRDGDIAVRLGGDEFAVLLPAKKYIGTERLASLTAELGNTSSWRQNVAASLGLGTAVPGYPVADAVRDADADMYARKRSRRAEHARSSLNRSA